MKTKRELIKPRRIMIEERSDRRMRNLAKWIRLERIPHVEQKNAAVAKDAIRLAHGSGFVWNEHHTELANGSVERTIGKRKSGRIGLLPDNMLAISKFRLREF